MSDSAAMYALCIHDIFKLLKNLSGMCYEYVNWEVSDCGYTSAVLGLHGMDSKLTWNLVSHIIA